MVQLDSQDRVIYLDSRGKSRKQSKKRKKDKQHKKVFFFVPFFKMKYK